MLSCSNCICCRLVSTVAIGTVVPQFLSCVNMENGMVICAQLPVGGVNVYLKSFPPVTTVEPAFNFILYLFPSPCAQNVIPTNICRSLAVPAAFMFVPIPTKAGSRFSFTVPVIIAAYEEPFAPPALIVNVT
jgi:hypothetical protein